MTKEMNYQDSQFLSSSDQSRPPHHHNPHVTAPDSLSQYTATCDTSDSDSCRDDAAALNLKFLAIASIILAGVFGVAIPLIAKNRWFLRVDGSPFVGAKAFAAGVILATGFVHMLPGGSDALSSSCLPEFPWSNFPFSGFFAMMASLATLLVDFVGTQYYEHKQILGRPIEAQLNTDNSGLYSVLPAQKEGMHIVGIHAHAAHHGHSHVRDKCDGHVVVSSGHVHVSGHSHGFGDDDDVDDGVRHVVVSQILELGIVSHSVIIGLSLGVSQSPCTIRPLIAALSFHQFFEGFALGGCISQAHFRDRSAAIMACFFAITTPLGIGVGIGVSSIYNPNSPGALVTEGILDSMSAGILVYMALVDLIAADFLSKRMSCNFRLQIVSYRFLFLGAGMMSLLAIWA